MMGFTFRFEALLKYRAHRKERAEVALGRAQRQLLQARETLESLQNRLREAGGEIQDALKKRASAERLRNHVDFVSGLRGRIQAQEQEVTQRREDVRARMKDVVESTRNVRIVEKLKERDHQTWLQEEQHQEQKVLDEMAVIRHGRAFM